MGSLAAGLTVSAVRWAIIDQIHHATGLSLPDFNFSRLTEHLLAFQLAVEHNYRYFQFYALCGTPHKAYYADLRIMRRSAVTPLTCRQTTAFC